MVAAVPSLGLLLPSIAVTVRRFHDRDMSGWWYLGFIVAGMIPVVGWIASIALLVIMALPGAEAWYARCLSLPLYPSLSDASAAEVTAAANRLTPILMGHGTEDPIVPLRLAEASRAALEARLPAVPRLRQRILCGTTGQDNDGGKRRCGKAHQRAA